jgi:hypothetical protein
MRYIVQTLDSLGQIAFEPAPYGLLAGADDLGDLRGGQALLGGQQNHLRTGPQSSLAGSAVQRL